MAGKPYIIAANKSDIADDKDVLERLRQASGVEVFEISAATTHGIGALMSAVSKMLNEEEERLSSTALEEAAKQGTERVYILRGHKLRDAKVERSGGAFILSGEGVERLLLRTDVYNEDALKRMYGMLIKAGIIQRLRDLGIKEGDAVRILDYEFDYSEASGIGV